MLENNKKSVSIVKRVVDGGETLILQLSGNLSSSTAGTAFKKTSEFFEKTIFPKVIVEAEQLKYCDGSGIAFLIELQGSQEEAGREFQIKGLADDYSKLFEMFDWRDLRKIKITEKECEPLPVQAGKWTVAVLEDTKLLITFVGELLSALYFAFRHPAKTRWKEAIIVAESSGVNALPIVVLIGFLIGLVMAFQAAIPLQQFGGELFVANLIGLSMLRELGPLMTAIVLAGRSGSAFAAELGTMKVNEEIAALNTMGLDPVKFLVVTRVIAVVITTPLLTLFANIAGIFGGLFVLIALDIPPVVYFKQLASSVGLIDLAGGLVKATVFGVLVGGVGCLRGLQTGVGATAVGSSTTRAVVSGIVLIAIVDSIFSVVYYCIGI